MKNEFNIELGALINTKDLEKQIDSLNQKQKFRLLIQTEIDKVKTINDIKSFEKEIRSALSKIGAIDIIDFKDNNGQLKGFNVSIKDSYNNLTKLMYQIDETGKKLNLLNQSYNDKALGTGLQKNIKDLEKLEDKLSDIYQKATSSEKGLLFNDNFKQLSNEFEHIFSNINELKNSLEISPSAKDEISKQIKSYEELYKTLQNVEKAKLKALADNDDLVNAMADGREASEHKRNVELLKEQKAISDAINQSLSQKNELLQKQGTLLKGIKVTPNSSISDISSALSSNYGQEVTVKKLNDEYQKLGMTFRSFTAESKNVDGTLQQIKGTIDQTSGSVRVLESTTQQSVGITQKFTDTLTNTVAQFVTFQQAFVVLRDFIKGSIEYLIELDNSLNEIRIVTGMNASETEQLGIKYNKMAKEMSVSTKEVTQAAVEFYRQGLGESQVLESLQETIKYSKISGVELVQSAELITASVNSMGVSAERVVDVFSYLGDAAATGSDELGRALQKTGGTAGALGIEFEKIASWIAIISSKTRESATTVGDSVKSILARLQQLREKGYVEIEGGNIADASIVSKSLAKAQIDLMDSQTGQFRDFGTVIDELGAKWSSLDKNTQAYISTTLAGTQQQSRFLTLMEGYSDSVDLYNNALNSAGIATEKYTIYQESAQAAIDKFKATWEGVAQEFLDSNFLKDMINTGTGLMEVFGGLVGFLNTPVGQGTLAAILTGLIPMAPKRSNAA